MPNFLNKQAYEFGNKLILIGGPHGAGTVAIDNFLGDATAVQLLQQKTRRGWMHGRCWCLLALTYPHNGGDPRRLRNQ